MNYNLEVLFCISLGAPEKKHEPPLLESVLIQHDTFVTKEYSTSNKMVLTCYIRYATMAYEVVIVFEANVDKLQ
jgi:hypothetical protein